MPRSQTVEHTASAVTTSEVSALYHEVLDDSMKLATFVCHRLARWIVLQHSLITTAILTHLQYLYLPRVPICYMQFFLQKLLSVTRPF